MNKIIMLLFVVLGHECVAQGMYELNYVFQSKNSQNQTIATNEVEALLFYIGKNNTDNVLRARYKNNNGDYSIVEWSIFDSLTTKQGKQYLILYGKTSNYIEDKKNTIYFPETIRLKKDPQTGIFVADSVIDKDNRYAFIKSFKILEDDPYAKEVITKFYYSQKTIQNPPFFKSDTIHLITLTDNKEKKKIKISAEINTDNIVSTIEGLALASGMQFHHVDLSFRSSNFNRDFIQKKLSDFSPTSNSVVIFYYSGHGFRFDNQIDVWPNLDLRTVAGASYDENYLSLKANIFDKLSIKKHRLLIVVGECCNTKVPFPAPAEPVPLPASDSQFFDKNLAKKLVSYRGNILFSTCKPLESSYYYSGGYLGGYFGNNFCQNLMTEISYPTNKRPSWVNIFDKTVKSTTDQIRLLKSKALVFTDQNPLYQIDIADMMERNNGFITNTNND